jgi:hypothetical protein
MCGHRSITHLPSAEGTFEHCLISTRPWAALSDEDDSGPICPVCWGWLPQRVRQPPPSSHPWRVRHLPAYQPAEFREAFGADPGNGREFEVMRRVQVVYRKEARIDQSAAGTER